MDPFCTSTDRRHRLLVECSRRRRVLPNVYVPIQPASDRLLRRTTRRHRDRQRPLIDNCSRRSGADAAHDRSLAFPGRRRLRGAVLLRRETRFDGSDASATRTRKAPRRSAPEQFPRSSRGAKRLLPSRAILAEKSALVGRELPVLATRRAALGAGPPRLAWPDIDGGVVLRGPAAPRATARAHPGARRRFASPGARVSGAARALVRSTNPCALARC